MNRLALLPHVLLFFLASLLIGCDTPTTSGNNKVDVLQLWDREISLAELQAAFSDNALTPPLYEQRAGTRLYAVTIPFDIRSLPEEAAYDIVTVMVNVVKDVGTSSYPENEDARVVTAVPLSVDRTVDRETSTKVAAGFEAAVWILTGNVSVERSDSESYQRLYRTVSAHMTPSNEILWEFRPFQDEPILPGTYFVVAVIEVRDGTTGNLVLASAGCSVSLSQNLGLSEEVQPCLAGATQRIELGAE